MAEAAANQLKLYEIHTKHVVERVEVRYIWAEDEIDAVKMLGHQTEPFCTYKPKVWRENLFIGEVDNYEKIISLILSKPLERTNE